MDKELLKQGQKRLSKQRNNRLWWEIVTLIAVIVLAGTMYKLTYSAAAYAPDSTEGGVQETNYAAEDEPDADPQEEEQPDENGETVARAVEMLPLDLSLIHI